MWYIVRAVVSILPAHARNGKTADEREHRFDASHAHPAPAGSRIIVALWGMSNYAAYINSGMLAVLIVLACETHGGLAEPAAPAQMGGAG